MSIRYPNYQRICPEHRALVVSLGGAAASSDPIADKISSLANELKESWNPEHPDRMLLTVTGGTSPFNSSRRITERIIYRLERMYELSFKEPRLVLIGKSMGGCKLHKVANRLGEEGIEVALFVGVDMSCHLARHYDIYKTDGLDAMTFPKTVKSLINFFQATEYEIQTGHVALWEGHGQCQHSGPFSMCRDYNINVNKDHVRIDDQGEVLFEGNQTICRSEVGHLEIDNDPRLLTAIKTIIIKRVLDGL
jgi:hypothetical protein